MNNPEVIIVGAGLSGLAAACRLYESGKSFIVLEARDRLGGRVYTERYPDGFYLDLGGQWIGPTQDRMYDLCRKYNLNWYETYNRGINILDLKGGLGYYSGLIPKMSVPALLNIDYLLKKLDRLARQVPVERPWKSPRAEQWDSITLADFIRRHCISNSCYRVVCAGLETVFACELNEVSLLHALFYIRSGNSINTLLRIDQGAQQHRIAGGMQLLAERMAAPFMKSIYFHHAVRVIEQSREGVRVLGEGFSFQGRKLILAIPPPVAAQIDFQPALSLQKRQLLQKLSMGIVAKIFAVYQKPFWRDQNFSGQVVADTSAPFQTVFDASPEDASAGVLLAFSVGSRARSFFSLPVAERENMAIHSFTRYFGARAAHPSFYRDFCWADESWSQGCYAALYPTGAWTSYHDELARSEGNIHWAGTETSKIWYGYMEGAVRAGERAAHEILVQL